MKQPSLNSPIFSHKNTKSSGIAAIFFGPPQESTCMYVYVFVCGQSCGFVLPWTSG